MKAIILKEAGTAEKLEQAELPIPLINDQEVLIQAKAISINPVDIKTRIGKSLYSELRSQNPFIIPGMGCFRHRYRSRKGGHKIQTG